MHLPGGGVDGTADHRTLQLQESVDAMDANPLQVARNPLQVTLAEDFSLAVPTAIHHSAGPM
jgi:hypothetical protein